ncbi:hypothetical protein ACLOJK_039653 [Asimina triloba]
MPLHCKNPFLRTYFPSKTELFQTVTTNWLFQQKKERRFPAIPVKITVTVQNSRHLGDDQRRRQSSLAPIVSTNERKVREKPRKKEHHLWMKRDSAGSGQKALNLVQIVSKLPNEKEAIYGALDEWCAWETEFPLIAAAKALEILRKKSQWLRVIQVTKWMLSKGQGQTMGTFDTLLLAFDKDGRVEEAESMWNRILKMHTRSVPKRLFSRMISLYDRHHMPYKVLEVFADMEELGIKPDQDTTRRVARAFKKSGQEDKQMQVLKKYESKWKYLHFNGERVRVRTTPAWDE